MRNRFIADKKAALPMDYAPKKLADSMGGKEVKYIEKCLRFLVKLLPDFAKMTFVRKIEFIKIDRNASMNAIEAKLETMLKERS